jgi:hypothetical protein
MASDIHLIEAGCSPEPIWMIWRSGIYLLYRDKNPGLSFDQPVVSRYTNCATASVYICKHTYLKKYHPRMGCKMYLNIMQVDYEVSETEQSIMFVVCNIVCMD